MRALVIAAALLLSGCWEGPLFYSASDVVRPIEPGRYELTAPGDPPEQVFVTIAADGMTVIQDDRMGFVPLDPGASTFIMWGEPQTAEEREHVQYLVLHRLSMREYQLDIPQCEADERGVALAAGAQLVQERNINICRFQSREALHEAVRNLRPRPGTGGRMVRIDDGPR